MNKREKIENLNIEIRNCRRCRLSQTRTNVVLGEGDIYSRIMIVAQAPGESEDKEGRMFIGPSGKVLDELFEHAG
ncbi:MAG: uracil-DNA glycosylase family protein, partial [Candidatus Syntropharchaeia archaeon]